MTNEADESPEKLEARAIVLVAVVFLLVAASVAYLLYARGVFERTQTVVLLADDSEGVSVGMDVTFSGFPLGRVSGIELAPDGNARILVRVPSKDAHWLRTSSVFTMERSLVGGTRIRAYSGILTDPPLPDGAERTVLRGDATAEIPRLMNAARELLTVLDGLQPPDSGGFWAYQPDTGDTRFSSTDADLAKAQRENERPWAKGVSDDQQKAALAAFLRTLTDDALVSDVLVELEAADGRLLPLVDAVEGTEYRVVVSPRGGLVRYALGDAWKLCDALGLLDEPHRQPGPEARAVVDERLERDEREHVAQRRGRGGVDVLHGVRYPLVVSKHL